MTNVIDTGNVVFTQEIKKPITTDSDHPGPSIPTCSLHHTVHVWHLRNLHFHLFCNLRFLFSICRAIHHHTNITPFFFTDSE